MHLDIDGLASGTLKSLGYVQHAVRRPGSKVHREASALFELLKRQKMAFGKIHHVDIVPHACPVWCWVVISENAKRIAPPGCDLRNEGHQVIRDPLRIFANPSTLMRAHRIEIPKNGDPPLIVGPKKILEHFFDHQLGSAIRISSRAGVLFGQGEFLRLAIDGCGGTEYQLADTAFVHDFQQGNHSLYVILEVEQGFFDGFTDGFQASKMEDSLASMVAQCATKKITVTNVTFDEGDGLSCNLLYAPQGLGVRVREVVEDNDLVAGFKELERGVRAYVAGSTGDKNRIFLRHMVC
jgi:hypothetical protein